jgi:hypothetical protein
VHSNVKKSDISDVVDLTERAFRTMIASIVNVDQKTLHDRPVAALTKQNLRSFTKRHSDIQSKIHQSKKTRSQIVTDKDMLHIKLPNKYSSSSSSSKSSVTSRKEKFNERQESTIHKFNERQESTIHK